MKSVTVVRRKVAVALAGAACAVIGVLGVTASPASAEDVIWLSSQDSAATSVSTPSFKDVIWL